MAESSLDLGIESFIRGGRRDLRRIDEGVRVWFDVFEGNVVNINRPIGRIDSELEL